jgi:hypothetical protein
VYQAQALQSVPTTGEERSKGCSAWQGVQEQASRGGSPFDVEATYTDCLTPPHRLLEPIRYVPPVEYKEA